MVSTILLYVCFVGAVLLAPLSILLWLHENGIHPVDELLGRFRRLPHLAQLAILVFVANLIVYGSTKMPTNDVPGGGTAPTNDAPPMMSAPRLFASGQTIESDFSADELAVGYAVWRIGTNEDWRFDRPAHAEEIARWRLRGAAEDWQKVEDRVLTTAGELIMTNAVYTALGLQASFVPEANWTLLPTSNVPSVVWHDRTPWESERYTWQNAFLGCNTNMPVSAQLEITGEGGLLFRYDLSRAGEGITNGVAAVAREGREVSAPLATNVTSALFYRLRPEDLPRDADPDGDKLSSYQEIHLYRTDPRFVDSDGDGILDGREIEIGTNPLVRDSDNDGFVDGSDPDPLTATSLEDDSGNGIPDAYENHWFGGTNICCGVDARDETGFTLDGKMRAGLNPTNAASSCETVAENELVSWKLWDGFTMDCRANSSDPVFERTIRIERPNTWVNYYLSSRPDVAGGWSLQGMTLEWEDSDGVRGTAAASPPDDSLFLPLSTNNPQSVTFRLRANASQVRSAHAVYLVAYAPGVEVRGGRQVNVNGQKAYVYTDGSESSILVSIDWSKRPCKAVIRPEEQMLEGLGYMFEGSGGGFSYEGGVDGGVIHPDGPGVYQMPEFAAKNVPPAPRRKLLRAGNGSGGTLLIVLLPSVWYGADHCYNSVLLDGANGTLVRKCRYPLDSNCLWREWRRDSTGGFVCACKPGATSGVEGVGNVVTELSGDTIKATIQIGDEVVWSGSAIHKRVWDCEESGESELADECGDDCTDGCADGNCAGTEGHTLSSLKFRIPLGTPRKGQISGFAYFDTETPMMITPAVFKYMIRDDSNTTVTTNGSSRMVVCRDERGRSLLIAPCGNGVCVTINDASDTLEHIWNIVNVNGAANMVRFTKISRLDNVMEDWTYESVQDADTGKWHWQATDNIVGIREELRTEDRLNVDGTYTETRTKFNSAGDELGWTLSRSEVIGECESSVLRETHYEEWNGQNTIVRDATYWRDTGHRARNGRLKLMTANDRPWEYHAWDEYGRELMRVEQRNASEVPSAFPTVTSNGLENVSVLADAFLTTYDYTPLTGDDSHTNDRFRVRCETRYVVENGTAKMVGRTWHRFTHGMAANGFETLKDEMTRAASASSGFSDQQNARSYSIQFDEYGAGTHLLLRGQPVEEMDEEGVRTYRTYAVSGGFVTCTERKYNGTVQFPTYSVTMQDETYGMTVRTATYLTDGDVLIDEERSVYDDQNRLRSTAYLDGTSITNSYSCCRKLWSRDREGRRTLRSGVTGQDHLYYAEEEVWLQDVVSNGYKVTQHFVDAFGRETNTVTYVGTVSGEANDWTASSGKRMAEAATWYAGTGYDYSDSVDERGKYTYRNIDYWEDCECTYECEWASDASGETRENYDYWNGLRISRRSWDGKWTETRNWSEYDEFGRKIDFETMKASDCECFTNSIVHYDFLGRTVMTETPSGMTTSTYAGSSSRVLESVFTADDVTRTTTHLYDAYGEQIGTAADGIANRREVGYEELDDAWWKVTRESVVGSLTNSVTETRERLTGLVDGLRSETIIVSAEGVTNATRIVYDELTGLTTRTVTSSIGGTRTDISRYGLTLSSTTDEETTTYDYDALGRCVGRARIPAAPQGSPAFVQYEESSYNAVGDLIAQTTYTNETEGVTEVYGYDTFGRRILSVNALGDATTTEYDAVGNVIETAGATYPVRYEYDTAGRRTAMRTTRNGTTWDRTQWTYDPATGKCIAKRHADNSQIGYTFTPDGLPLRTTLASGAWKECAYDAQRRLIGQTSNDGREDAAFAYDEFSRMTAASNGVAQIGYALHRGGIATNETVAIGTNAYELARSVDEFGRIAGRGLVGGERTAIAYTAANRVESVTSAAVGVTYLYTGDGQDAGYQLTVGGTTLRREVTRDAYRRALVTAVSNFVNGVAIAGLRYGHDALSRVTARGWDETTDEFGYNEKGEVTYASLNGWENNYSYDQIGNFLSVAQGTNATVYAANALNQYTAAGDTALSYTSDGCLTGFGGLTFAYDSGSRLTSVSSNGVVIAAYDYDAFDRRVRKVTPEAETTFVYDGWNLVLEEVAHTNGAVDRIEYVWGKDLSGTLDGAGGVGGLLYLKHNGAIYIPLYDANGSVIGYLDAAGNLVATFAYDAFGNELPSTAHVPCSLIPDPSLFHFRYSTKYLDPESGLYYYGYRFYSPILARWLTRDPIEEQGGLNLYGFCGNNGVGLYDINGMFIQDLLNNLFELYARGREFWNSVANVMRGDGYEIAADMLEYSLHGDDNERTFYEAHEITGAIKNSVEYAKIMADLLSRQPKGLSKYSGYSTGLDFNSSNNKDLAYAIGGSKLTVNGSVCKRNHFSGDVNLNVEVSDDYDFHWHKPSDRPNEKAQVLWGNNAAYVSQYLFLITKYHWRSLFTETRWFN